MPKKFRRKILTLIFAALVIAIIVPVVGALDAQGTIGHIVLADRPLIHSTERMPASHRMLLSLPDSARLLLVGAGLIGLGAAVRKRT
jgi:hypothetical protein